MTICKFDCYEYPPTKNTISVLAIIQCELGRLETVTGEQTKLYKCYWVLHWSASLSDADFTCTTLLYLCRPRTRPPSFVGPSDCSSPRFISDALAFESLPDISLVSTSLANVILFESFFLSHLRSQFNGL